MGRLGTSGELVRMPAYVWHERSKALADGCSQQGQWQYQRPTHLEGIYPNSSSWRASGAHPEEGHRGLPSSVDEVCFPPLLSFLSVCVCYINILKSSYMASAPILHYHSLEQCERILPPPAFRATPSHSSVICLGVGLYHWWIKREDFEYHGETFPWKLVNYENCIERGDPKLERIQTYSLMRLAELEREKTLSVGPGTR